MPNHVDTTLTVTGDAKQLAKFIKKHVTINKDEEKKLDFDTIIPCPQELYDYSGIGDSDEEDSIKRIKESNDLNSLDKMKRIAQMVQTAKLAKRNKKLYGYVGWYDFCNAEWGTKWGAYECTICSSTKNEFVMSYNTAWSPAVPIFKKLATMYPKLTFENICIDEGWCYAGRFVCAGEDYDENFVKGGEQIAQFINEYQGGNYVKCEKHDHWYEDGEGCYACDSEEVKDEE
jgi:hypothetical protein